MIFSDEKTSQAPIQHLISTSDLANTVPKSCEA